MSDVPPPVIKIEDTDSEEEDNASEEDGDPQLNVTLGLQVGPRNPGGHHNHNHNNTKCSCGCGHDIVQKLPAQSPKKSILKNSNNCHRRSTSTKSNSNGVSGMDSSSSYYNNHPCNLYPPQFYPFPPFHPGVPQMPFPYNFWPNPQFPHLPGGGGIGGHQMNRTYSNGSNLDNNYSQFYPSSSLSHHSRQPEQLQKQKQHEPGTPSKKRAKVTFSATTTTFCPSTVEGGTQTDDVIDEQQQSGSSSSNRKKNAEGADAPTNTAQTDDLGTRAVNPPPVKRGRGRKSGQKKEKKNKQ